MQDAYPTFIQPEIGEVTVIRAVLLYEDTQYRSGAGLRLDTRSFNSSQGFKGADSSSVVKFPVEIGLILYGINRTGKIIFPKPVW